jgi:N6-L-threonylcarbamoyladenine synthase
MTKLAQKYDKRVAIPPLSLTTDNAAMIAVSGYFKYIRNQFSGYTEVPYSSI